MYTSNTIDKIGFVMFFQPSVDEFFHRTRTTDVTEVSYENVVSDDSSSDDVTRRLSQLNVHEHTMGNKKFVCHPLKYSKFFFISFLLLVRGIEPLQFDPQAPALPPKERRIQFPMDEHVANGTLKANTTPAQTNSGTATPNAPPRRRDRKQTDSVSSSFCSFLC